MIGEAVRTHLLTVAPLTALVGDRIHPERLPQRPPLPALTYFVRRDERHVAHDGKLDLATATVQIDAWDERRSVVDLVKTQVVEALVGFVGGMGDIPYVSVVGMTNSLDLFEEQSGYRRTTMDFEVWYDARVTA